MLSAGSTIELSDKVASTLNPKVLGEIVDGVNPAANDADDSNASALDSSASDAVVTDGVGGDQSLANEVVGDVIEDVTTPAPAPTKTTAKK